MALPSELGGLDLSSDICLEIRYSSLRSTSSNVRILDESFVSLNAEMPVDVSRISLQKRYKSKEIKVKCDPGK